MGARGGDLGCEQWTSAQRRIIKVAVVCGLAAAAALSLTFRGLNSHHAPLPHHQRSLLQDLGPKPESENGCADVVHQGLDDACEYVRSHCETEAKIPYLEVYYCYVRPRGKLASVGLQVGCVLLLLMLFRVLGSTAEDYFSPILTQISQDLGLPPRFAGVTFLALGNGAPDISASVAAVKMGAYPLALAGLLGGGMFVGCAVSGAVILMGNGAKARGALMRDVGSYLLAVLAVVAILASGTFTRPAAIGLLCFYCAFVLIVLAADTFHILSTKGQSTQYKQEGAEAPLLRSRSSGSLRSDVENKPPIAEFMPPMEVARASRAEVEMTHSPDVSISSNDVDGLPGRNTTAPVASSVDNLHHWLTYDERVHLTARAFRERGLREQELDEEGEEEGPLPARGRAHSCPTDEEMANLRGYTPPLLAHPTQSVPVEHMAMAGSGEPPTEEQQPTAGAGPRGIADEEEGVGQEEPGWRRAAQLVVDGVSLLLAVIESPLYLLRRATIPLVEAEYYNRRWFLASLMGAPAAVAAYLGLGWQVALLGAGLGALLAVALALLIGNNDAAPYWDCGTGFPVGASVVAVAGFVVAAMWIDSIATELVGLLDYFGVLMRVDHAILGLTILAWGNSIGDMVTDIAIARKGLPNMALTACFAGPIFNLLISLGLGFLWLLGTDVDGQVSVKLSTLDAIGASFLTVMCLSVLGTGIACSGRLPREMGYFLISLYAIYLVTSVVFVLHAQHPGSEP